MSTNELRITVKPDGSIAAIHNDALADLYDEGKAEVKRASHVEPVDGESVSWAADMSPVGGEMLGPFPLRSEALKAETDWLEEHGF